MSEPKVLCPVCEAAVPLSAAMGPPALADFVCPRGHRFGPGVDAFDAGVYDDRESEKPRKAV